MPKSALEFNHIPEREKRRKVKRMKLKREDLQGSSRTELEMLCLCQAGKIDRLSAALATLRSGDVYAAMQKNIDEKQKIIDSMVERNYAYERNMAKMHESSTYRDYPKKGD
jgi:serine/threonine-protein kinase RIO1